jgi:hypothetical protein
MKLVDQWSAIERRLPAGWESVTLRLRPEQETDLARAAQVLGSMGAGRVGGELALTVSRFGGASGPQAATRLFERLDDARVWCELEQQGSSSDTTPVAPLVAEAEPSSTSLSDGWDELVATLPSDWGVLLCRLEIDSSDELPRTALLCAPLNPARDGDDLAFTFRCGRTSGYGVSPAMARRCFERMDGEGLPGRVSVLRLLSEMDNVATQGATWLVGGRVL